MWGHLVAVAALQVALVFLARSLRRRLTPLVVAAGLLLPHLVLAPWIARGQLVVPTVVIERVFLGSPRSGLEADHAALSDAVFQLLPWEFAVRDAFREHRLPLWSDRIDGGSSPWANPQAGVLSPVANLARLVPIEDSPLTSMVLKMLLALEGAWLAARVLGAGSGPSLLAGIGFALGGGVVAWGVFPLSTTLAWTPWLLAAVVTLVRRARSSGLIACTLTTATIVLSGHPEVAFAAGVLAAVCGVALFSRRTGFVRGVGTAALAGVLGLGLAAPHVLPFLWTARHSQRVDDFVDRPLPKTKPIWNQPLTWSLGNQVLLALQPTNPRALGRPYHDPTPGYAWPVPGSGYAGLVIFAGAAAALALPRRRDLPLWTFGLVGIVLSLEVIPVERVLRAVPGVRVFAVNRALPVAMLCLCLLAAIGITRLLRRRKAGVGWAALLVAAGVSLTVAHPPWIVAMWSCLVAAVVIGRRRVRLGISLLTLLLLLDLVPWSRDMLPIGSRELFYPETPATEAMRRVTSRDGPWRVTAHGRRYYPSSLSPFGIEDVRYHNPLTPRAYARILRRVFGFHDERGYFSSFRVGDHPMLDFLNVRVVVSRTIAKVPERLQPMLSTRGGSVRLYRNSGALRRFFVAPSVEVVEPAGVVEATVALTDPRRVVLSSRDAQGWRPHERPWRPRAARIQRLSPGSVDLRVPSKGEKLLATSLPQPDGWVARSGRNSLRRLTINGAFLGVIVPDGVSRVQLRFVPPGMRVGVAICAVSLIAVAWIGFRAKRAKAQQQG